MRRVTMPARHRLSRFWFPAASLLLSLAAPAGAQEQVPPTSPVLDPALLAGMQARSIGPAGMSGRIADVVGRPGDPTFVLVGAATGGLWRSTDGAVTFQPIFDDQDVAAVGAVAVDPRNPDVIWLGTGEGNPRNSASVGRGVYRTLDGGRTWQHLGLGGSERIHRILLDPRDGATAWVAALGPTWSDSDERGVYVTRDGGRTWHRSLFVGDSTGCADLAMDPRDPDRLVAAMWDHRRTPWSFRSGGPGSGLHVTLDGGRSWQQRTHHDGLPKGELGRIGLAIAASEPRVVYALVEAKKSVLLRSDDGGFTFRTVNSGDGIAPRPFYYADLRVDPRDPDRVYNLHTVVDVSDDGGRTFRTLIGWDAAHPDHHAMWIDPTDPRRIVIGNDGGVYLSQDRGETWRFCPNLPLAQFYHVAVDHDVPFNVYGGLQDNGSWRGPSRVFENGGIRNHHWEEVGFGDGFATLPDPADSMRGYAMSQGGALMRWNLRTGERKGIRPPAPDGVELRFHWNAGIAQDPFDAATIYYGSQFVHRSGDRGDSWQVISPDLTTDNPEWQQQDESGGLTRDVTGAENHCTILTIAPSPVQRGVLWVGTDDGRVQVTRDGGATWTSVEDRIEGLPRNTWCPHIEPDRQQAGAAFAVFDGHRRGDWRPYVYRTEDWGQTWRSLATSALDGYALCLEQDPADPALLFLGTEFGLWFSPDAGATWHRWRHGLPTVSAMALTVHPRDHDLVVGTHGRAIYVLDDVRPLRGLTAEVLNRKLQLFPIPDAIAYRSKQTGAARFPGHSEFRGSNPPRGAILSVVCNAPELEHPDAKVQRQRPAAKDTPPAAGTDPTAVPPDQPAAGDAAAAAGRPKEPPKDQVTVEVRDAEGALVRTFRSKVKLGLNRVVWDLDRDGVQGPSRELREPPETPPGGREVLPGDYTVTVHFQGAESSASVRVLPDPRVPADPVARVLKDAAQARAQTIAADLGKATQRLARARRDVELVQKRLELEPKPGADTADPHAALRKALTAVNQALDATSEELWGPKDVQGILRGKGLVAETMREMGGLGSSWDAPNATEMLGLERARAIADRAIAAVDRLLTGPLTEFRNAVEQSGLGLLPAVAPVHDGR